MFILETYPAIFDWYDADLEEVYQLDVFQPKVYHAQNAYELIQQLSPKVAEEIGPDQRTFDYLNIIYRCLVTFVKEGIANNKHRFKEMQLDIDQENLDFDVKIKINNEEISIYEAECINANHTIEDPVEDFFLDQENEGPSFQDIHKLSSNNFAAVVENETFGCFYCADIHPTSLITEHDLLAFGESTIFCPACGIDAVLPNCKTEYYDELTTEMLAMMYYLYF